MNIKSLISTAALIAGMSAIAPTATAGEYSASVDVTSEYVFRGVTLGTESIQTGVEGAWGDFYAGAWANAGFGRESIVNGDELDIYAGYGFALSDTISADLGATIYHYPQLGDFTDFDDASTFELYAGVAFDNEIAPAAYVYYDTTLETLTVEGSAGYSFAVSDAVSLDLSGAVGNVSPDEGDGYTYGSLGAALSYGLSDLASAYIGANAGFSSEDTFTDLNDLFDDLEDDGEADGDYSDGSSFWFGAGVSTGF